MMKNLNEPHRRDENLSRSEVATQAGTRSEGDVVPFEQHAKTHDNEGSGALLLPRQTEELRMRWTTIQTNFVDEPRKAVEGADRLVADAIKQIEEVFQAQRSNLEKQWSRGDKVSTEDLRVALQRYRDFFDRLLSMKDARM